MKSIETDLYSGAFRGWGLKPLKGVRGYGPEGVLHTFENEIGSGEYWAYFRGNLFAVNAFRMSFAKSGTMRYRCSEHICLGCYDDVRGMAQRRGAALVPGAIMVYLGDEHGEYEAHFSKGAVARASSITISPDYYRDYLQSRFGNVKDVREAFIKVDGKHDLPELVDLLRKARAYQGKGIAAELFYEGVVAEAVALVMEYASREDGSGEHRALSQGDACAISHISSYIADNLSGDLSCARLASELYIGQTKLKRLFKTATGLSSSAYVTRERMEEAARLLRETDLLIASIGKAVGYHKPGAFTEAFRRSKGFSPADFRRSNGVWRSQRIPEQPAHAACHKARDGRQYEGGSQAP